jgi:hypothetical protein
MCGENSGDILEHVLDSVDNDATLLGWIERRSLQRVAMQTILHSRPQDQGGSFYAAFSDIGSISAAMDQPERASALSVQAGSRLRQLWQETELRRRLRCD